MSETINGARTMFKTGQMIGEKYVIERLLGEGGMGAVYVARHDVLGRMVAIKTLHPEHARSSEMSQRFIREAKAASRIRHEHIVDVLDIDMTQDGILYIVMELLGGESLAQRLQRTGRLPIPKVAEICGQILLGLRKAHASGIIHRDIKPENVFLTTLAGRRDFVKILDFGISKFTDPSSTGAGMMDLTRTGMMIGTPVYMSPEQARGEKVDHRIDIYAAGVILYEMVTGALPHEASNVQALAFKVATEEPTAPRAVFPDIPPELEAVILKAMARKPDQRFYSAAEFFVRLKPFGARDYSEEKSTDAGWAAAPEAKPGPTVQETLSATSDSSSAVFPDRPKKRWLAPVIAAALIIAAVAGALLVWKLPGGENREKEAMESTRIDILPGKRGASPTAPPEKKSYSLRVTARPPAAAISLDGALLQGNPAEVRIPAGEDHLVSAQAEGFETRQMRVNLTQDRDLSFDLIPLKETSPLKEKDETQMGKKAAAGRTKETAAVSPVPAPPKPSAVIIEPVPEPATASKPPEKKTKKKIISDEWEDTEKSAGAKPKPKPKPGKKIIKDTWDDIEG